MKTSFNLAVYASILVGLLLAAIYFLSIQPPERIHSAYQLYTKNKIEERLNGKVKAEAPELHGIIQREIRTRTGEESPAYRPNQVLEEYLTAKESVQRKSKLRTATNSLEFVERGPGNVGGRTRALIVDPGDPDQETFFAGAASGGIWKTTNAGEDWEYISSDIPNMGVNALVMAPTNTSIIYAGTGEHFTNDIDGAGMFKSTDRGETWIQIANPTEMSDFKNVSRIIVDPNDENTVIATTRSTVWGSFSAAIYKTTDGGASWTQLRSSTSQRYDDIDYDPSDFNTLYVAVQGEGVIKSTDGGETWQNSSIGMVPSGRVEITISPVNSNRLWASVEGGLSGGGSDLYVSSDGGANWQIVVNANGTNEDFLGGQGWYDNIITAHPFDENIVYVGGVNTWKFELEGSESTEITSIQPVQNGTVSFMSFVNFGGGYLGGGMDLGTVGNKDLLPIEIRFGDGIQMAHRFTVGGEGPGVPASSYVYEDYVQVPFQVWDTENNVQLMASFRDQQEDGEWNLIASNTEGATQSQSREYLYVHNIPYSEEASTQIAQTAGHEVGQMYFFWPVLAAGASFDAQSLPQSNLAVVFQTTFGTTRLTTNVSDAYGAFNGPNGFPQATRTQGLHPDQHNIVMYDLDEEAQTFRMLVGNDGGVYRTIADTDPGPTEGHYEFISYGYNTTQFYGADKAPGQNRYAGGMQDNGTWYHAEGIEGGAAVDATFGIGGDGFEVLWHSTDPNKIIGGSQYNNFASTFNGGTSWISATSGFDDEGPFVTRLAHHKSLPDRIFTVGSQGVWMSSDFGSGWSASTMQNGVLWSFSNSADVEVSYANPDVIWAGGALQENGRLFVSTDGGFNFSPSENYSDFQMGSISGIGTHPTNDQVAYALFSFAGFPKVIKTEDLGQTWEDISGFDGTGAASDRGFPDVAVNCLFVFPNNTNRIWVGSEIGIIESLDAGSTWALLDGGMPPVNIYDLKLVEDQIVIATYGRGIWSVTVDGIVLPPTISEGYTSILGKWVITTRLSSSFDSLKVYLEGQLLGTEVDVPAGEANLQFDAQTTDGMKLVKMIGYFNGKEYSAEEKEFYFVGLNEGKEVFETDFSSSVADFSTDGFSVINTTEIDNMALQTSHPYLNGNDLYAYLKTPIQVNRNSATITYEDIALVEPGQPESSFGQEEFNDYVVFEASTDGLNWMALEPGYDASLYEDWSMAFETGTVSEELYKRHEIKLLDAYSNGQWLMFRFRLNANESTNGYGWVIDNLKIQTEMVLSSEVPERLFKIYPNPISHSATLKFNGHVPQMINVLDINGKKVTQISTKGQNELSWTPTGINKGVYFLNYSSGQRIISTRVIVQ